MQIPSLTTSTCFILGLPTLSMRTPAFCATWLLVMTAPLRAEFSLTADGAAELARKSNPELAAARRLIAEAEARARTTGRLANPELAAEVAGGQDYEGRVSLGITQRFPLTGRLHFERELSASEVEIAHLEVRNRERQLAVSTRNTYYELAAVRASISLADQQAALASKFAKSLNDAVTQGFGSSLDADQARLAAETYRSHAELLQSGEVIALAKLNSLLGRPADSPLATQGSLELPKTLPEKRPMGFRADLQLAETTARAGATAVSLAGASRWEDVGVGLFVEGERFRDEPEGIEPEALVGVQFSVPFPVWQNGSGKIAEMKTAQSRKAQTLEALRFNVRNEILAAHSILAARYRSATDIQSKLIPLAQKQVSDAEAAYSRGEVDIQAVFRARERLIEIESAALEARKQYFYAHSEWLGALGDSQP